MLVLNLSLDELKEQITGIIGATIQESLKTEVNEKLISPKETCDLFSPKISLTTLRKWTDEGHLNEHRIGGRVFYKYGEIINRPAYLNRRKLKNL